MSALPQRAAATWAVALALGFAVAACGGGSPESREPAAQAAVIVNETELLRITLSAAAEQRLGLTTVRVARGMANPRRILPGEIVVPPAPGGVPISASTDLTALASNQARTEADVERARSELQLAQQAAQRADALVREEAGSMRARDEARAALAGARATYNGALDQRRLLGNSVNNIRSPGTVWVRVSVFAGDVGSVDRRQAAVVRLLGTEQAGRTARPVDAPPSASPAAGTVDLYYALSNPGGTLRLGQRVSVELPFSGQAEGLMVPNDAVLRDINGGEWVYVRTAPRTYERRRVELAATSGGQAVVRRGLQSGSEVVTAGAAELFGFEFGAE